MREHAVPQQISSYEFRLVGDMTLKQFFQLASGALVSLVIYASSLPGIIKWPLIIFFAFLGVALAFLPLEERALSSWITAFIKAVYSPTQYLWRENAAEEVFSKTAYKEPVPEPAQKQQELAVPHSKVLSVFEEAEATFLNQVRDLFHRTPAALKPEELAPTAQVQATPRTQIPTVEEIPTTPPVRVAQPQQKQAQQQAQPQQPEPEPQKIGPVFREQPQQPSQAAQAAFSPEAAPPSPPSQPNTIVGQILTSEGKIVEGAILEIKDTSGRPVRALKSNKVGHFMSVTPLQNGEYEIEVEKEGLEFDKVKFSAEGKIIPPIQIRAKKETQ